MNPLFWLTLLVTTFVAYHVGSFITIRNINSSAEELMAQMNADNATGSPIGAGLAREMGIEL